MGAKPQFSTHTHTHTHTHGCLYKVIFSIIAITAITNSAYSTNITSNNNDCDNGTLTTYSGIVELEADWSANNVDITFYNGDSEYTTGQCTYDGTLTLPSTDPTKDGYTFNGWKVRRATAPQCSINDVDTSINGTGYGYTKLNGDTGSKEVQYGLTTGSGEWAVKFDYGIIKGVSRCSTVGNEYTMGQTGNPTDDLDLNNTNNGAQYCWCKLTEYTQTIFIPDDNATNNDPNIYLVGYSQRVKCIQAVRIPTGLGLSDARVLVESASPESPQLISGATYADIETLTDAGCTVQGGVAGHNEVLQCYIGTPSWVFHDRVYGIAIDCAYNCANYCGTDVYNSDFRSIVFGQSN